MAFIGAWLSFLRHAEKKLFGYSNLTNPTMIICDHSMIFIQTLFS